MTPNPQPAENPFWHAFGLEKVVLPPESAAEEELPSAKEIDLISTVVALSATAPAVPSAHVWDEIQAQISGQTTATAPLGRSWRTFSTWGGWGVAASLAVLFAWQSSRPKAPHAPLVAQPSVASPAPVGPELVPGVPAPPAVSTGAEPSELPPETVAAVPLPLPVTPPPSVENWPNQEAVAQQERAEKHRLIQEIETLRGQLARLQERTQERLAVIPGVSWPVVIEMHPPGVQMETVDAPLTSRLGDALVSQAPPAAATPAAAVVENEALVASAPLSAAAGSSLDTETARAAGTQSAARPTPSATPIYDPARDIGTLALHHFDELKRTPVANVSLPTGNASSPASALSPFSETAQNPSTEGTFARSADTVYSLWVKATATGDPILVGQLPNDLPANTSVDFSLGTTGLIPQGYYIIGTQAEQPLIYHPQNVLLQGP